MKITLELYNEKYTAESEQNDYTGDELKEIFSRMMVLAGYSPSVIELDGGGRYEYLSEDEAIIKKEEKADGLLGSLLGGEE